MFADSLDEFDDSQGRGPIARDEYIAAESPDYVEWGVGEETRTEGCLDDGGGGAFASRVRGASVSSVFCGVDGVSGAPGLPRVF